VITLDGLPLSTWGLKHVNSHAHPSSPEIREKTLAIPGRAGKWNFGADWDSREFNFPLVIIEQNKNEIQRKLRTFVAFLLDSVGKPRDIKMMFDYEPEKYYIVRYSGQISPERLFSLGQFELRLVANDPYAYADSTAYSDNPKKVAWNTNGMAVTLTNHSQFETPVQIRIRGAVLNPKVTNLNTYRSIQVNEQFTTTLGDLVIDSHNYTVRRVKNEQDIYFLSGTYPAKTSESLTTTNLLSSYVGDFIFLTSGENTLYFEGTNINTNIYFDWKHRFI
jgi:predicted phage tail component-like protein